MALADPPTEVAAEATTSTVIIITWVTPVTPAGDEPTGYKITRSLNGAATATLVADTGNILTKFTDTTLAARDNAVYQLFSVNATGTGTLGSDTASATTSTSEAQTIKELLFNNWALTGELSKTIVNDMTEVVNFLDRGQVPGNKKAKMVTVQKINELGNENIVEHPKFFEQSDTFEITCFLQVTDSADDIFSDWVDRMQQMTSEVTKILRTKYAPSSTTGEFFRTNTDWTRDDTFAFDEPMLVRTLRFVLTKIKSNDLTVFSGYGGLLVFDTSESEGDTKPGADYTYTQVTDIDTNEGFSLIPYFTKDTTNGVGVPHYARGIFNGSFSAIMYAKGEDFNLTTINALDNIYRPQTSGSIQKQLAQVVLLQTNPDTQSTVATLTRTATMKINNISFIDKDEELLKFRIRGTLTKITGFKVAAE